MESSNQEKKMRGFLGPNKKGSVILFKEAAPSPLPTLNDIRLNFGITGGSFYKSHGWFRYEIDQIENLLNVISVANGNHPPRGNFTSDFIYYTEEDITSNSMFILKYSNVIIGAFNLTTDCMTDLQNMLRTHLDVSSTRRRPTSFIDKLEDEALSYREDGSTDLSITNPDIDNLRKIFTGYADQEYHAICTKLQAWHDTYQWK
jgi:hypothetical protein